MPERIGNFIKAAAVFAGVVASATLIWNTLETEVKRLDEQKADKVEVRAEMQKLERVLERLDERTARMDRFVCRQLPSDLGCP